MAKSKIIEVERWTNRAVFVDVRPVDDPSCVHDEDDPRSAFALYVCPRIKASRDEASKEVLAFMKSGASLSDAILHTIQSLPAGKTRKLRAWIDEANSTRIYVYVEIDPGSEAASVGLRRTTGGPKDQLVEAFEIERYGLSEDFAAYKSFEDAMRAIENHIEEPAPVSLRGKGSSLYLTKRLEQESKSLDAAKKQEHLREIERLFEDNVAVVELTTASQYSQVLEAMHLPPSRGKWNGPGAYDFAVVPPARIGTIKEYEAWCERTEAEYYFDDYWPEASELKTACAELRKAGTR